MLKARKKIAVFVVCIMVLSIFPAFDFARNRNEALAVDTPSIEEVLGLEVTTLESLGINEAAPRFPLVGPSVDGVLAIHNPMQLMLAILMYQAPTPYLTLELQADINLGANTVLPIASGQFLDLTSAAHAPEGGFTIFHGDNSVFLVNDDSWLSIDGVNLRGSGGGDHGAVYVIGGFDLNDGTISHFNSSAVTVGVAGFDGYARFTIEEGGTISNNTAYRGGGVYVAGSDSDFDMRGGVIRDNSAYRGGGVYVANSDSYFDMSGGVIRDNSAYRGGGVYVSGHFSIRSGQIINNNASFGGGIYIANMAYSSNTRIGREENHSHTIVISGNTAAHDGGGIFVGSNVTIWGAIINDNTAGSGGGIFIGSDYVRHYFDISEDSFIVSSAQALIARSTISGNSAHTGGGIYSDRGWIEFLDTTIENNRASHTGGGMFGRGGILATVLPLPITDNIAVSRPSYSNIFICGVMVLMASCWGE